MDTMKINTSFTKNIIGNIVSKIIKKKTGGDVNLQINDISIEHDPLKGESFNLHLDINVSLSKEEVKKLLNTAYGIGV